MFICSQNKRRSLTAEKILNNANDWEVRSAGTENNARIKVTGGMIGWSDIIFTMEKKHTRRLQGKYATELVGKKLVCLHIPDDYDFMDRELASIIEAKVGDYFNKTRA